MKIERSSGTSNHAVAAYDGAEIRLDGVTFGDGFTQGLMMATRGGSILLTTTSAPAVRIRENCARAIRLLAGGVFKTSGTPRVDIIGSRTFSTAFITATGNAYTEPSLAFEDGSGDPPSVTGTRYDATLNAVINTFGGGANYFPGDSAGTTATGGQYA
jgi:hypothetical protein